MMYYQEAKGLITTYVPVAHDALHMIVGLSLHLAMCVIFKKKLHWCGAIIAVALAASAGEIIDYADDIVSYGRWIWPESVKDFTLTLLPTILLTIYSILRRG